MLPQVLELFDSFLLDIGTQTLKQVERLAQCLKMVGREGDSEIICKMKYDEMHHSLGALDQNELMIHIERFLKDKKYRPKDFMDKQFERLLRLVNRFLIFKGRIYRRGIEGQHRLYVQKENRTYMITALLMIIMDIEDFSRLEDYYRKDSGGQKWKETLNDSYKLVTLAKRGNNN